MISSTDLRSATIFDCFDEAYLKEIASQSADVLLNEGEFLFFEGDVAAFYVLLEGAVDLERDVVRRRHVVCSFQAGDFFGEVPLLLGSKNLTDARARTAVRVARISQDLFHKLLNHSQPCKQSIVDALMSRIGSTGALVDEVRFPEVVLVGDTKDRSASELRRFLANVRTPYVWIDRSTQPERAHAYVGRCTEYPIAIIGGKQSVTPRIREMADLLGLPTEPRQSYYDVIVIGAGPAGLAAAVYGASEGLTVLVIDQNAPGGQAGTSSRIENYLGFPGGISGDQLTERALKQASRFGAEVVITRRVAALERKSGTLTVVLDGDVRLVAGSVILASGVDWRRLQAEEVEKFIGHGVTYGADRAEAPFVVGKVVFIVGGGNSAGQAAMFFSSYAAEVIVLVRGDSLQKSMSQYLIDQLATKRNISVETSTEVLSVAGVRCVEKILTINRKTTLVREREAYALFIMIGASANTGWLPEEIARDEHGFVLTGADAVKYRRTTRNPLSLETTLPNVLAAGDVRHGSIKRVASAVGEGSMAIAIVHQLRDSSPR